MYVIFVINFGGFIECIDCIFIELTFLMYILQSNNILQFSYAKVIYLFYRFFTLAVAILICWFNITRIHLALMVRIKFYCTRHQSIKL